MSYLIAVTGKGGVGKTTVSSLIIKQMVVAGKKPVLAIDADPNSCLDAALGVKVEKTVGRVREEAKVEASKGMGAGISKQDLLQMKIEESLVESQGFDLIAMGRPEGAGCYCYANNVLKSVIGKLSDQYPYVVLDNEAGLENLSRRIVQKVNLLILVSDQSNSGLETLKRLYTLADEMEIKYDKLLIVVNRMRTDTLPEKAAEVKEYTHADEVIGLPDDLELANLADTGESFEALGDDNAVIKKINNLVSNI
ncbi:MAG: AAA family ATPase [Clostridia bacterium]|jgi:CO dehydrogenase maturation factor|nr:AAA family ATPase [Clostridia bacterium]